ncbi:MAG: potassium channel protein [Gemmatimonadota bacterium]
MNRPRPPTGRISGRSLDRFLSDPVNQLQLSLFVLVMLVVFGSLGYILIERMSPVEALYMTVITLSTVGFQEVRPLSTAGMIFTVGLIMLGLLLVTWAVRNAAEIALGHNLFYSVRRRRMKERIAQARDHYLVCGYGALGRQIVRELTARGEQFVVVESAEALEEELLESHVPVILGDATHDETLLDAGVERARGVVAALGTDADNVLTVLTARELNPGLLIVARAASDTSESKLRRAGADRIVTPDTIGGHRLAIALVRPAVHDFMSRIFHVGDELDVDVGQVTVQAGSVLEGQTLSTCDLRSQWNVTILAIEMPDKKFILTPPAGHRLTEGETLIVIGPAESIYMLEAQYALAASA